MTNQLPNLENGFSQAINKFDRMLFERCGGSCQPSWRFSWVNIKRDFHIKTDGLERCQSTRPCNIRTRCSWAHVGRSWTGWPWWTSMISGWTFCCILWLLAENDIKTASKRRNHHCDMCLYPRFYCVGEDVQHSSVGTWRGLRAIATKSKCFSPADAREAQAAVHFDDDKKTQSTHVLAVRTTVRRGQTSVRLQSCYRCHRNVELWYHLGIAAQVRRLILLSWLHKELQ